MGVQVWVPAWLGVAARVRVRATSWVTAWLGAGAGAGAGGAASGGRRFSGVRRWGRPPAGGQPEAGEPGRAADQLAVRPAWWRARPTALPLPLLLRLVLRLLFQYLFQYAAGLVVEERAGGEAATAQADAAAFQVTGGFELVEGPADRRLALTETERQRLDGGRYAIGERLDVHGEPDRDRGETLVLGEVVADHREAVGVAMPYVKDTRTWGPGRERRERRVHRVRRQGGARLRVSHGKGLLPVW